MNLAQLDAQIIAALEADNPQSVRHVFYLMTDQRLPVYVQKSDKGKDNGYGRVQRRLKQLREAGQIPFNHVVDMTRRGYHVATYDGQGDFLRRVAGLYRANLWGEVGVRVEVWAESRSIAAVLEADCRELAVSLYPTGGFSSMSLADVAAREHVQHQQFTYSGVIYYVGDWDKSGREIGRDVERKLPKYIKRLGGDPDWLRFDRLAINEEQIAAYNLSEKPGKGSDTVTVEAEAMPSGILRGIVRDAVESHLPAGALHAARVAEESEREGLRKLSGHF